MGGLNVTTRVFMKGRQGGRYQSQRSCDHGGREEREEGRPLLAVMMGGVHEPSNAGGLQTLGKATKQILLYSLQKEPALILAHQDGL